jgi:hypothetical protein
MKNFLTFRALDSALLHKADLNENDVIAPLRATMINDKLMKIYRLLDGLNDPWFHKTTTLVAGSDIISIRNSGGDIALTAVDPNAKTLQKVAGVWTVGDIFSMSFWNSSTGARICDFVGKVISINGAICTYTVLKGSDAGMTMSSSTYMGFQLKGASTLTLDLSSLYVKDILKIYDNGYTGGKIRIFTPIKDPAIFAVLHRDPYFDTRIAFFQLADTVNLYQGAGAAALGTIQFEYRGKPALCADFDSDVFIDLPPEDNQILMDEVLSEYLQAANKEVPPDVATRNAEFQKRYDAAMADLQKTTTTVKGIRNY